MLILVRGIPSSGKSTIIRQFKLLMDKNIVILDPDNVDVKTEKYKVFKPMHTKNPSENVKMYCFLFHEAKNALSNKQIVFWLQPWSRLAEIELTIRNLSFYSNKDKTGIWHKNVGDLLKNLPFKFFVVEINIEENLILERLKGRRYSDYEIQRTMRTYKMFQELPNVIPHIKINGNIAINENVLILRENLGV